MVGCNFRFHPALQQIQRLLVAGSLGRVITARGHAGEFLPGWHPGEDWRLGYSARKELGGGVILTLIHELDYAYWLFGPVRKVFAQAGGWGGLGLDVEDTAEILLEHRSQSRVSVHLNYVQRPPTRTLEIIAERGTIQWDYQAGLVKWYDSETARWEIWTEPPTFDRNTMFLDEVTHFIDCVAGRSTPLIPLTEAKAVLEIALAAKQSAEEDCFVSLKDS
jgi:predicted dehydrogenase